MHALRRDEGRFVLTVRALLGQAIQGEEANVVHELIGKVTQQAEDLGVQKAKQALAKAEHILGGPTPRAPADIAKEEAHFTRGTDLRTADGKPPVVQTPVSKDGEPPKPSVADFGRPIEFIHFGYVHRDDARNFEHPKLDDSLRIDAARPVGARAIVFRAALEREAVLLGATVLATRAVLEAKGQSGGATTDLLTTAADLVGGASRGTSQRAAAGDLAPFLGKLTAIWSLIAPIAIRYAALHEAGIKLHEVRVNLRAYVREQLRALQNAPEASRQGLLADLPLIGAIKIPGALGEVVGFLQKVTDKAQDVRVTTVFALVLAMAPAVDQTCHKATLRALGERFTPIYPVWRAVAAGGDGAHESDFATYNPEEPAKGIPGASTLNKWAKDAASAYNKTLNSAAGEPLKVVSFLKKKTARAPSAEWLDDAFQVSTAPDAVPGPLAGGGTLGEVAFVAFARALGGSDAIPGFLTGFARTMVTGVFQIAAEFLRAVYVRLCAMDVGETVSTEAMVQAGREQVLLSLQDFALHRSGLAAVIGKIRASIPELPYTPPGVHWPQGELFAEPIVAAVKKPLAEKLGPFLNPVVEFAMRNLAGRLNATRAWAGMSVTMEVHLGQLPAELAALFTDLFGPLWDFYNKTLMGAVNDGVNAAVGPLADAVGLTKKGARGALGMIADAERKAAQAQAWAKKVEDQAQNLYARASEAMGAMGKINDARSLGGAMGSALVAAGAADTLSDALNAGAFGGAAGPPGDDAPFPESSFQPRIRMPVGVGAKVDKAARDEVEPYNLWDTARDAQETT